MHPSARKEHLIRREIWQVASGKGLGNQFLGQLPFRSTGIENSGGHIDS